ncbi:hypothetical protein RB195_012248 [Necator americanus]|uniref:Uncharacterized protein n=1 Tax=Necator americanus TaxID=51031 RepID=A0ABR1D9C0_NECAM
MLEVDPHHQRSQAARLPIWNLAHYDVGISNLSSTVWSDANRSTGFEEFVEFKLEEATLLRKRKLWTEAVKEDLRTLGVDWQFRRVGFRWTWNSDEWIDSVQALAEDREGWAELC